MSIPWIKKERGFLKNNEFVSNNYINQQCISNCDEIPIVLEGYCKDITRATSNKNQVTQLFSSIDLSRRICTVHLTLRKDCYQNKMNIVTSFVIFDSNGSKAEKKEYPSSIKVTS